MGRAVTYSMHEIPRFSSFPFHKAAVVVCVCVGGLFGALMYVCAFVLVLVL